jgi:predicted Zn-dependent protease with MMP-like domain
LHFLNHPATGKVVVNSKASNQAERNEKERGKTPKEIKLYRTHLDSNIETNKASNDFT